MKIILASQSPRRKEILESLGVSFEVEASCTDEYFDPTLPLDKALKNVAYQKAKAIFDQHPDACVIGADTIVAFEGKLYGKPKDLEEARMFLESFSGKIQQVMTGICILYKDKKYCHVDVTDVVFRPLSDQDISDYLQHFNVLDKAGAYGIQDSDFVTEIRGSYTNVVGLGKESMEKMLKEIGGLE